MPRDPLDRASLAICAGALAYLAIHVLVAIARFAH